MVGPWFVMSDRLTNCYPPSSPTQPSVVAEKAGGSIKVNVSSGIKTLMVLKTTQSGFENFHRDEYRALPDASDRSVVLLCFVTGLALGHCLWHCMSAIIGVCAKRIPF